MRAGFAEAIARMLEHELSPGCDDEILKQAASRHSNSQPSDPIDADKADSFLLFQPYSGSVVRHR